LHLPERNEGTKKMHDLSCSAKPVQELALLAEQFDQPERLEQSGSEMHGHQSRKAL
jgi:hypothetical protein